MSQPGGGTQPEADPGAALDPTAFDAPEPGAGEPSGSAGFAAGGGEPTDSLPPWFGNPNPDVSTVELPAWAIAGRDDGARRRGLPRLDSVPGYEILDELGRGGMGVVYKARQVGLNRTVALKMILAGAHAGAVAIRRFRAEAEAVGRLQHPNIIQIFEIGEHEGHAYFSLEYAPGGSLAGRLDGTPWPPHAAARLAEMLARAVGAAHREGIVHRDLKPGNVLLMGDGTPKVADFGLAKRLDAEGPTSTGIAVGTPSYMAPEQALGGELVGPAADVYALGVILYELLTGRPPFKGPSAMATLAMVVGEEPVAPGRLQPTISRDAETICLKCLQKEPARRYASAEALAEDLRRYGAGEPIAARPIGRAARAWRWCRRNPTTAGLLAAVGALLAAVALGATAAAIALARGNARLEATLYDERIALADREWSDRNLGRVKDLLEGCPARLRGWEWHYLENLSHGATPRVLPGRPRDGLHMAIRPDGRVLARAGNSGPIELVEAATGRVIAELSGHDGRAHGLAFSPDGRRLASAGGDHSVRIWDATTGRELHRLDGHPDLVVSVAFSPDGARLASVGYDDKVRVWDVETGRAAAVLAGHDGFVYGVAIGPGDRVASAGHDGTVRLWDLPTRRCTRVLRGHSREVFAVAWSADGRQLASASLDETLRLWHPETGRPAGLLRGHANQVMAVAFSPDGTRLASGGADKLVKVWDAATGKDVLTLRGFDGCVFSTAFAAEGLLLAAAGGDGTVRLWDARPEAGRGTLEPIQTLTGHRKRVNSVAFDRAGHIVSASSDWTVKVRPGRPGRGETRTIEAGAAALGVATAPDGRIAAACADGAIRVWGPADRGEPLVLRRHRGEVGGVAFDATGSRLASGGEDRIVRIWDSATGRLIRELPGHAGRVYAVAFSPVGGRLASAGGLEDCLVKVWDRDAATDPHPHPHDLSIRPHAAYDVAFSPDGSLVAAACSDGTVRVWEVPSWTERPRRPGHLGIVTGVAFSPDGRRLATAGWDKTVRLWDAGDGREVRTFFGHAGVLRDVAISPDGARIAAGGDDGSVEIWDARPPGPPAADPPARGPIGLHTGPMPVPVPAPEGAGRTGSDR